MSKQNNEFCDFLANKGLYETKEITKDNVKDLIELLNGDAKMDIYCTKCKKERLFSCEEILYFKDDRGEIKCESLGQKVSNNLNRPYMLNLPEESWVWTDEVRALHNTNTGEHITLPNNPNAILKDETRILTFKFTCLMKHHLDFIVVTDGNVMRKIGQYPSFIDLSSYELKEYQKSMSKQDEKDFKSAEILYSMGMGIGAFAYLRRIFERIIAEAEKMAIDNKEFNESDFANCHIKEKVKKLKQYLPKSMSDNTSFYKVVSEGIHNFNDKECIENYETLKHFIVTFFREKDNLRREKEEKKRYESSLNRISSKIK